MIQFAKEGDATAIAQMAQNAQNPELQAVAQEEEYLKMPSVLDEVEDVITRTHWPRFVTGQSPLNASDRADLAILGAQNLSGYTGPEVAIYLLEFGEQLLVGVDPAQR